METVNKASTSIYGTGHSQKPKKQRIGQYQIFQIFFRNARIRSYPFCPTDLICQKTDLILGRPNNYKIFDIKTYLV